MKTMIRILAIAMLLVPLLAMAATTGNELIAECKSSTKKIHCYGYMEGAIDAHEAILISIDVRARKAGTFSGDVKRFYCLGEKVTVAQITNVFLKWTDANPAKTNQPAYWLLMLAMQDAFPCPD